MGYASDHQYIHFHTTEYIYLFHKIQNELYMKTIKDNKIYTDTKISSKVLDYTMNVDDLGLFHLVTITSLGQLKYFVHKDNEWHCKFLLNAEIESSKFSHPKIFIINHTIYILFLISTIASSEIWMLKHDDLSNQTWSSEKVCTVLTEKYQIPFHADIDRSKNIHIVYKSYNHQNHPIFYSKYNTTHNIWSIPLKISDLPQENIHPFIFCDNHNCVHIIWSSFYRNNLQIFYVNNKRRNPMTNHWTDIRRLSKEGRNCSFPFMLQIEDTLKIVWKQGGKYHMIMRNVLENKWNSFEEILFNRHIKLSPTIILGNTYKTIKSVKIPMTYSLVADDLFSMGIEPIPDGKVANFNTLLHNNKHQGNNKAKKIEQPYHNHGTTGKLSSENLSKQNHSLKDRLHLPKKKDRFQGSLQTSTKLFTPHANTKDISKNIPQFLNDNKVQICPKVQSTGHEKNQPKTTKNEFFDFLNNEKNKNLNNQFQSLRKMIEAIQANHVHLNRELDIIYQKQKDENQKINTLINSSRKLKK